MKYRKQTYAVRSSPSVLIILSCTTYVCKKKFAGIIWEFLLRKSYDVATTKTTNFMG